MLKIFLDLTGRPSNEKTHSSLGSEILTQLEHGRIQISRQATTTLPSLRPTVPPQPAVQKSKLLRSTL
ncbi:hypothetical protein J6590_081194 [Homalodisca vitripennis]|nr:hypothetical protein J6590_081194 [Homalodisca vitripennis]